MCVYICYVKYMLYLEHREKTKIMDSRNITGDCHDLVRPQIIFLFLPFLSLFF